MRFVNDPNLPNNAVLLLVGEKYTDILKGKLSEYGIELLAAPRNPDVDERLSSHADLSVLHAGGERILLAPYLKGSSFANTLKEFGIEAEYPEIVQRKEYPYDTQMNICVFGKYVICNSSFENSPLVNCLTIGGRRKVLSSRQGYAKCSVCVVDENSIITSDAGISKVASSSGIDVLLIQPGYIELQGFEYGFIGGSAFKISENMIAFTGILDKHPDKRHILDFIEKRGIEPVYLTELPIFDIGSAIPIIEK